MATSTSRRATRNRSLIPAGDAGRPDRRKDILASAETLFAQRGFAAVSVRDIAADAGVPIALVGYYFGRKQELFVTVFEHRKVYIAERIERIKAVDCTSTNPNAVEDLIKAWALPFMKLRSSESGESFALLVARTAWDPSPEAIDVVHQFYDSLAQTFIERMTLALPGCSQPQIIWGYEYALGALLMHAADKRVERLSAGRLKSGDESYAGEFIRFVANGFRALGLN